MPVMVPFEGSADRRGTADEDTDGLPHTVATVVTVSKSRSGRRGDLPKRRQEHADKMALRQGLEPLGFRLLQSIVLCLRDTHGLLEPATGTAPELARIVESELRDRNDITTLFEEMKNSARRSEAQKARFTATALTKMVEWRNTQM